MVKFSSFLAWHDIDHFFYLFKQYSTFSEFTVALSKHEEGWENSRQVMQTRDVVGGLHNFREFSEPSEYLDEAM